MKLIEKDNMGYYTREFLATLTDKEIGLLIQSGPGKNYRGLIREKIRRLRAKAKDVK